VSRTRENNGGDGEETGGWEGGRERERERGRGRERERETGGESQDVDEIIIIDDPVLQTINVKPSASRYFIFRRGRACASARRTRLTVL